MGGQTSTQKTENKPPAWAQPLFEQSAAEAQKIYASGKGGNVYQGDTTAGLGAGTQSGIKAVSQAAANPNTGANTYGTFGNLASSATAGANNYSNMLTGLGKITTGSGYENLLASTKGPLSSEKNLGAMASGEYLKSGNPYFNSAIQGQLDATADQVQSQFSGAGRYGSGANTSVLTQQLGNIRSTALADQFNRDSANMLAANGQIDSATLGRLNAQSGALAGLTGVQNQNIQNQMGQITSAAGIKNQGIQTAGNLTQQQAALDQQKWQNMLTGGQAQIQAGQLQDRAKQAELDAALAKFQATDNKDWTRLGLLQAAASGSAGNYGTGTTTQRTSTNPLSVLGGVGSIATK